MAAAAILLLCVLPSFFLIDSASASVYSMDGQYGEKEFTGSVEDSEELVFKEFFGNWGNIEGQDLAKIEKSDLEEEALKKIDTIVDETVQSDEWMEGDLNAGLSRDNLTKVLNTEIEKKITQMIDEFKKEKNLKKEMEFKST